MKKISIVIKKHENVLKTGFAKIFSCCPEKMGGSKIWGGGLQPPTTLPSPWPVHPLNETKKDKLFFKQLRSCYLLRVRKKYIPFLN